MRQGGPGGLGVCFCRKGTNGKGGRRGGGRRKEDGVAMLSKALAVFLLFAMCVVSVEGQTFNPAFQWMGQTLFECQEVNAEFPTICDKTFSAPVSNIPAGERRACIQNPSIQYECSSWDPEDEVFIENTVGCSCEGLCLKSECLPVFSSLEDTWSSLNLKILHRPGPNTPPKEFTQRPDDKITVVFDVLFGSLDIFGTISDCGESPARGAGSAWVIPAGSSWIDIGGDPYVWRCEVDMSLIPTPPNGVSCSITEEEVANCVPEFIVYELFELSDALTRRRVTIIGNFPQMNEGVVALKYRADPDMNTERLRSFLYSGVRSDSYKYDALNTTLSFSVVGSGFVPVGEPILQIISIMSINDEPTIRNPSELYVAPSECSDASSENFFCNFGQFWVLEDSDTSLSITGTLIDDLDLYESCVKTDPECANLDVLVQAYKGALQLNTRSNLNFYLSQRGAGGFTANTRDVENAVKVLFYRVENLDMLNTAASTTWNYNTQRGIASEVEYVSVQVSDQGFSGADGMSKMAETLIPIVIVAKNDAPIIQMGLGEYSTAEDMLTLYPLDAAGLPISFTDVDIDDDLDSIVATKNWLGQSGLSEFKNKIQITGQLRHGALKFGYVRKLRIVATEVTEYATMQWSSFGHDLCRVSNLIADPTSMAGAGNGLYRDVCVLANLGTFSCLTGEEEGCYCKLEGLCQDGSILLQFNRSTTAIGSQTQRDNYQATLKAAVATQDISCGGMPVFPAPNNFTHGKSCLNHADCADDELPKCIPGITCKCCMNISHTCADFTDCEQFDIGSKCGCMLPDQSSSGERGTCGPFYTNSEMSGEPRTTNLVRVGSEAGETLPQLYGPECFYAGTGSELCRAAAFVMEGTELPARVGSISLLSLGSRYVQLVGALVDVNRALQQMYYITDPQFNRLWRPPLADRDPLTFDIEKDQLETLTIIANDLGNSGGGAYDPKELQMSVNMRISAVNDPPQALAPATVLAYEDLPLHFLPTKLPPGAPSTFESYSRKPLQVEGIQMYDPDLQDYGFAFRTMSVNLSCSHGRLFLNEEFLKLPGVANERIKFIQWNGMTEYRGLHSIMLNGGGQPLLDPNGQVQSQPRYGMDSHSQTSSFNPKGSKGKGCQFEPSCADDAEKKTADSPFGFQSTPWYGLVYSPQYQNNREITKQMGCGICPEWVGNKFISFVGTYQDINLALSRVTYLPDPHFNTRYGVEEKIIFQVSDDGAIGNDVNAPPLTAQTVIDVVVESINDRPIIGRRIRETREINSFDGRTPVKIVEDWAVQVIDKSKEAGCFQSEPSGKFYNEICEIATRQFIDVDEDTLFVVAPDILWIYDADAAEAEIMPDPARRRYCCPQAGPKGCKCRQACLCGTRPCSCAVPGVCNGQSGQILVNIEVSNGFLSFFPPPGRSLFAFEQVTFLTNETDTDMLKGGPMMACPDQTVCMRNVTRLQFRTSLGDLQTALDQYFLTYVGKPNFAGTDQIRVWINDRGMTDECYNSSLVATETVNIRVVAVNDPPSITMPTRVLQYPKGQRCFSNYHKAGKLSIEGMNSECVAIINQERDTSSVPPAQQSLDKWVNPTDYLQYADIDLNDEPPIPPVQAQFTLTLAVGNDMLRHADSGSLFLNDTIRHNRIWHELFLLDGLTAMQLEGRIELVNILLKRLKYDASPSFQGYVPFVLFASDNRWYGECSGDHLCGAGNPCINSRTATAHLPPQIGTLRTVVDVTVQAPERCKSTSCDACNKEAGCGWCPTACKALGGKCMITGNDRSSPKFEICIPGERIVNGTKQTISWMQCESVAGNIIVPISAGVGSFVVFCISVFFHHRWILKRHGSVRVYIVKKRGDFARDLAKLYLLPPSHADYFKVFCVAICVAITAAVTTILGATGITPSCTFEEQIFLDRASSVILNLDNCQVRFLPTRTQPSPESELEAVKIKISIKNDPKIRLEGETCGQDIKITVNNTLPASIKYVGYYCSIKVLVPDRFVMPSTTIYAVGDNITTVRAGPMDKDTPNFGLDFGPNEFKLAGTRMTARLQNVTAKKFKFDILHGGLIAVDLRATAGGEFNSQDADMIVTTSRPTSARFWQKSGNKVCLTAANGSLYVDNSCNSVCIFKDVNSTNSSTLGTSRRSSYGRSVFINDADVNSHGKSQTLSRIWKHSSPPSSAHLFTPPQRMADVTPLRRWEAAHVPNDVEGGDDDGDHDFNIDGDERFRDDRRLSWKLSTEDRRQLGAQTMTVQGLVITDPVASDPRSPWVCTGHPNMDKEWSCLRYNATDLALSEKCPPGNKHQFKSQVKRVPNCTNLDICFEDESSKCLCKPTCDMLNLDPPGICDDAGRCCQVLCTGYSKADLFPTANQPRCGFELNPEWQWCTDDLEQKFKFTSVSGQISLQVLLSCDPQSPGKCGCDPLDYDKCKGMQTVSSYNGSKPVASFLNDNETDSINTKVDLTSNSAFILNTRFHLNDKTSPTEEWFTINVNGPGMPEATYGTFVWLASIRHAVLPPWLMRFLSYGILAPERDESTVKLNPGFCPSFVDMNTAAFNRRLVNVQTVLMKTVQNVPGSLLPRIIPYGTQIAFIPIADKPKTFLTDPGTSNVFVIDIEPFNHPLLIALLALGLCIPLVIATLVTWLLSHTFKAYLNRYRRSKLMNEQTMRQISQVLGKMSVDLDEDNIPREQFDEMRAQTNFFHVYEEFFGIMMLNQGLLVKTLSVFCSFDIVVLPIVFTLKMMDQFEVAYRLEACSKRQDICACMTEISGVLYIPLVIRIFLWAYFGIATLEVTFYYLAVEYNKARRVLRTMFYVSFFTTVWVGLALMFFVLTFIFLSVLVNPAAVAPYVISVAGALIVVASIFAKLNKYCIRVQRAVSKRLIMYETKASRRIPPTVLDALMSRNIQVSLREHGLATPMVLFNCGIYLTVMLIVYMFVFFGFIAFTDVKDFDSALLNDFLLMVIIMISYQVSVAETDSEVLRDKIDVTVENIMVSLSSIISMVEDQIMLAETLVGRMERRVINTEAGEDSS